MIKAQGAVELFPQVVQNITFYSLYKNNDPSVKIKKKAKPKGLRVKNRSDKLLKFCIPFLCHDIFLLSVPTCHCTRKLQQGAGGVKGEDTGRQSKCKWGRMYSYGILKNLR